MNTHIQVLRLRIVGIDRYYEVPFRPGLNVIAGEISTGKTTILQLIDYCFGASKHPEHIELQRRARSVLLEFVANGATYVIERPLFNSKRNASIHECSLEGLGEPHTVHDVWASQVLDKESLSSFILKQLGLWDVELKEAPTKSDSETDRMSFRDVMPFCYLPNKRLDNEALLFENEYMKALKFKQVFDVLFGLYENKEAIISRQISRLNAQYSKLEQETQTLSAFLRENSIPAADALQKSRDRLSIDAQSLERAIADLADIQRTHTQHADSLRAEYHQVEEDLRRAHSNRYEKETLLKRLVPLRGEYAQSIKKLSFLQQAQTVFDPIGISYCPACGANVEQRAKPIETCFLCHSELHKHDVMEPSPTVTVNKELNALGARLRELNGFIDEVEADVVDADKEIQGLLGIKQTLGARINEATRNFVAPEVSQRDILVSNLAKCRQELADVDGKITLWGGISQRHKKMADLQTLVTAKHRELDEAKANAASRDEIVVTLSERFGMMLERFKFPKLQSPKIDADLVPHVRGLAYTGLGSSGALTLTSLGWYLAVFGTALDRAARHPGVLMIDSPQKNIGAHNKKEPEFRDDAIVFGIYQTFLEICREHPDAQIIVVDNAPPDVAVPFINVRFTGRAGVPPYGLIDDEEGN